MGVNENRTRVLLADDHVAVLSQVAGVIANRCDVVGTVSNGLELLGAARKLAPDLIILDVSMPVMDGFEALRQLKCGGCKSKVIFLTVWEDADFSKEAMALGADGYVVKSSLAWDLLPAIAGVMRGDTFVSPSLAN
jgi:DNA-binding NarL/FixJ family response regulator